MTTEIANWRRVGLLLALLLGLAACETGRSGVRGGLPSTTVAAYPANIQKAYGKFSVKCSRCHTLARPLNAAIYDHAHWERYVGRMRRHAGSGISPRDADEILVFLRYFADNRARAAGVTRTSTTGGAR